MTDRTASVGTPTQPTEYDSDHSPKAKHWQKPILLICTAIVLIGVSTYVAYYWQHQKVSQLQANLIASQSLLVKANNEYSSLQKTNKRLEDKIASEEKSSQNLATTANTATSNSSSSSALANYQDPDFVTIAPNSGLGTKPGSITFSWTPQKYATYYELEIRYLNQATYPTASNQNQFVHFSDTQNQPSTISLTYSLSPTTFTNYVWRVTAYGVINGVNTALQSTSDNNLSIMPSSN